MPPRAEMDDAGGGRRGLRPVLTAAEMQTVDRSYGVSTSSARDLGGSANLNLLIEGKSGPLVLRAYRRHVTPDRVVALQAAGDVLPSKELRWRRWYPPAPERRLSRSA